MSPFCVRVGFVSDAGFHQLFLEILGLRHLTEGKGQGETLHACQFYSLISNTCNNETPPTPPIIKHPEH